jgi:hypothetical protein
MVDTESGTFVYSDFSQGLNLRDDENNLPIGETPFAQNFEIVPATGLAKIKGWTTKFDLGSGYDFRRVFDYWDVYNKHWYVGVSYPQVFLLSPDNGAPNAIYSGLSATGNPILIKCNKGRAMLVDGSNAPVLIDSGTATTVTWPPNYTNTNKTLLNESNLTTDANPSLTAIGFPSFGVYFTNRVWLAGDKLNPNRIYVSRISPITSFGDNTPTDFDIAFFVDLPVNAPITSLKIISDQYLVAYCEREIHTITGKFPPGSAFPGPYYDENLLNDSVGALSEYLVASRGNNDHFYIANEGVVNQLTSTENFQDVKPLALSEKIYPALKLLNNDTFKRGRLINHKIKGELQLWIPDETYHRQINDCYVYSYSDKSEIVAWSKNTAFGGIEVRDVFIDSDSNDLIIVTPNKLLKANDGYSFDGNTIKMVYQLATLDFGDPDRNKEIISIDMYAYSSTGASVQLYHLWENNADGLVTFDFEAQDLALYGSAVFGSNSFAPTAGQPFQRVTHKLQNPVGKILKCRIVNDSSTDEIIIKQLVFRFAMLGKS